MGAVNEEQLKYLRSHEVCRLATASRDAKPHVVPVIYAIDGDDIIVAVDYGTKKLRNLRENPMVALVVDEYKPRPMEVVSSTGLRTIGRTPGARGSLSS